MSIFSGAVSDAKRHAQGFGGAIRPPQKGFTLLEVLVVIVILAILLGAVGLNLGGQVERRIEVEAQRLVQRLQLAQFEAQQTGQALRWITQAKGARGYLFMRQVTDPTGQSFWIAAARSASDALAPQRFQFAPDSIAISYSLPGAAQTATVPKKNVTTDNQVVLQLHSDELTPPATIHLQYPERAVQIHLDGLGDFQIQFASQ